MTEILLLGLVGILAGLLAGFLGIGGGIILVPALIFLFESQKVPSEVATQLAVGTSLASIIFTGSASSWMHHRHGNVDWRVVWGMAVFIAMGTQIGALIAGILHGKTLKQLFGIFEFFVAARMLTGLEQIALIHTAGMPPASLNAGNAMPAKWFLYPIAGLGIGTLSSLFGIGGGTLTVPLLVYILHRPIKTAIGTSSAQGIIIAFFGTLGFIYNGWGLLALPAGVLGYVSLPAALLISVTSTLSAPLGALLAHRIQPIYLSRFFGVLLIFVGMRLVGLL